MLMGKDTGLSAKIYVCRPKTGAISAPVFTNVPKKMVGRTGEVRSNPFFDEIMRLRLLLGLECVPALGADFEFVAVAAHEA